MKTGGSSLRTSPRSRRTEPASASKGFAMPGTRTSCRKERRNLPRRTTGNRCQRGAAAVGERARRSPRRRRRSRRRHGRFQSRPGVRSRRQRLALHAYEHQPRSSGRLRLREPRGRMALNDVPTATHLSIGRLASLIPPRLITGRRSSKADRRPIRILMQHAARAIVRKAPKSSAQSGYRQTSGKRS